MSDVSGAAGLGLLLALRRGLGPAPTGNGDRSVWLAAWAFAPFVLALLVSTAEARVSRSLPDRGRARVRASRGVAIDRDRDPECAGRGRSAVVATSIGLVCGTRPETRGTGAARTGGAPCDRPRERAEQRGPSSSPRGRRFRGASTTERGRRTCRPRTPSGSSPGRRPATRLPSRIVVRLGFGDHRAGRAARVRSEGERAALGRMELARAAVPGLACGDERARR